MADTAAAAPTDDKRKSRTVRNLTESHRNRWRKIITIAAVLWALTPCAQAISHAPEVPLSVHRNGQIVAGSIAIRVVPELATLPAGMREALESALAQMTEPAPKTLQDVTQWSERLTQALRQGGFPVGLVVMTADDWETANRTGYTVFSVYPGRVSHVVLQNHSRAKDGHLIKVIHQALCNTQDLSATSCVLQTANLERTTQLLQDIPGVRMDGTPQAAPGEGTGAVQLTFSVAEQGEPYTFGASIDNQGVESTGKTRLGASVSGNNVFGIGDNYAANVFVTNKQMWTGGVMASVPLGDQGLRATAGWSAQTYSINAGTALSGLSNTANIGIDYPFTRGLDRNVRGQILLLHTNSKTTWDDFDFSTRSTLSSVRFQMQADNGDRQIALRAEPWSVVGAITVGHQSSDEASFDAGPQRAGNYAKFTLLGSKIWQIGGTGNTYVLSRLNTQWASKNLDFSEKMMLGGPSAVRAYPIDEESADDAAVLNLGLYHRFPIFPGHQLQLGTFVDVAFARINHDPWPGWSSGYVGIPNVRNERLLSGYGVSADWLTPIGLTLSLSLARRFPFSPASWSQSALPTQVWLAMSWSH